MRFSFLALLAFAFLSQLTAAQVTITNVCPADAPVSLQASLVQIGSSHADVIITNKGDRPVTAVVLNVRVTDSTGAPYDETSSVDYAPSGVLFDPGKSTKTQIDLNIRRGRSLVRAEVNCLAVLYSGRGVWGDAKSPEVTHIRSVRQGIAAERKRLLAIYAKEGITGLVDELNRPVAR